MAAAHVACPWSELLLLLLSLLMSSTCRIVLVDCTQVQDGELGRSAAVKVHSALQKLLDSSCCKANSDSYALRNVNPYKGLYNKYCSKTRDKQLVAARAASDVGLSRAAVLHQSFGRETFLVACRRLLESDDHGDVMLLSMFTGQVSMVARGDDLRSRRLPDLSTRMMACVGK